MYFTKKQFSVFFLLVQLIGYTEAGFEWTGGTTATIDASSDTACDTFLTLVATGSPGFQEITYVVDSSSADGGFSIVPALLDTFLSCDINKIQGNTVTSYTVTIRYSTARPESATQDITITVTNLPILTFVSPTDGATFTQQEDASIGTDITTLSASKGSTTSGFTFSLLTSTALFQISSDKLKTAADLDLEANGAQSQHTLQLRVSDGSSNVDINVTVNIGDLNDNAPQFTSTSDIKIPKNAMTGDVIVTITATDADVTSPNNNVTYSLNDTTILNIGSTTGEVTLQQDASSLDENSMANYAVEVTAADGGTSPQSTSVVYKVTLESQQTTATTETGNVTRQTGDDSGASSKHRLGVVFSLLPILLCMFVL